MLEPLAVTVHAAKRFPDVKGAKAVVLGCGPIGILLIQSLKALGAAKVMGINIMDNFDTPYFAGSVSDFWKRWHMSLTKFLTKYIYIPLGGSKKGKALTWLNTMIVFLISGIWHGAYWTFILWGLGYFVLLVLERELGLKLGHVGTMICVILLWVVFRWLSPTPRIWKAFIRISH